MGPLGAIVCCVVVGLLPFATDLAGGSNSLCPGYWRVQLYLTKASPAQSPVAIVESSWPVVRLGPTGRRFPAAQTQFARGPAPITNLCLLARFCLLFELKANTHTHFSCGHAPVSCTISARCSQSSRQFASARPKCRRRPTFAMQVAWRPISTRAAAGDAPNTRETPT